MRVCKTHRTSDEIFGPDPLAITRGFETEKYSIDFHDHDFYEINVVFAGTGYHYIENRKFDAAPGDVFVIPPGTLHAYENKDSQFNVFHLIAKNEFFAEFAHALQQISCFKLLMEIEPYLRRQNRRFFLSLNHKELLDFKGQAQIIAQLEGDTAPEAHGIRNVQTLKLICDLCRYMSGNLDRLRSGRKQERGEILLVLDYIHKHYGEKINVGQLADLAGVSKPTLNRLFHTCCQTTPNSYILAYRCEMAMAMLQTGKGKAQTAQECGFYDQSHMERILKKQNDPLSV